MSIERSLSPFPSRTIALYTARMFLVRTFAVLAMLVLVLQALDMLGESGKILAQPGNGQDDLWTYVGLRIPQDRTNTRLNSSHQCAYRIPSSACKKQQSNT